MHWQPIDAKCGRILNNSSLIFIIIICTVRKSMFPVSETLGPLFLGALHLFNFIRERMHLANFYLWEWEGHHEIKNRMDDLTFFSSSSRASAAWAEPSRPTSSALREALLSSGTDGSSEHALKLDRRLSTWSRPPGSPPTKKEQQRYSTAPLWWSRDHAQKAKMEKKSIHLHRKKSPLHLSSI